MKLSIIIPTYKREKILCQTIDSVIKELNNSNLTEGEYELIIVDQTKEHTAEVASYLDGLKVHSFLKYVYESVANLPNARNVGISYAQGEIILFLDDDVVLYPGFFDILIKDYQEHPEVNSVVGLPVLKNESGQNILLNNESVLKKHIKKVLQKIICRKKSSVITPWGLLISNRDESSSGYTDTGRGCLMSFRKNVFDLLGGFDKNYIGNALREETDFFCRMKKAKMRVFFNNSIRLDHIMANVGGCRSEKSENYWETYLNNQFYFFRKNFGFCKSYIAFLLYMDIKEIKKQGYNQKELINRAWSRSVNI